MCSQYVLTNVFGRISDNVTNIKFHCAFILITAIVVIVNEFDK